MSSLRTPSGTEAVASDTQGAGAHNEGAVVQNMGAMVWEPGIKDWVPAVGAVSDAAIADTVPLIANGLLNQAGSIDRQRNNLTNNAIAPGAYTETKASEVIKNYNHSKLLIYLHIEKAGSGTLRLSLINDQRTEVTYPPNTGTDQVMAIAPGLATQNGVSEGEQIVATLSTNMLVPTKFQIKVTPSGSTTWEYSVNYDLLV